MAIVRRRRAAAVAATTMVKKEAAPYVKREATPRIKKEATPSVEPESHEAGDAIATQRALQKQFTITPKTARLLMQAGFPSYHDLRHVSTNEVIARLGALPGMTPADAKNYRAAMRRLVYVATLSSSEAPSYPKRCTEWSQKGLRAKGAWREDYDDLTGDETKALLE